MRSGALWFASEIKGLLAIDPGLAEPDLEVLHEHLALRVIAPPRTMFRAIRKLPPAHFLTFSEEQGLSIERYWNSPMSPSTRAPRTR